MTFMTLTEVEEGELLAVQRLMEACIGSWAPSPVQLHDLYRSGKARIFVVRRKHPFGFAVVGPLLSPDEATGTIYSLGVQQRFRRRGLGGALLAAAEGWLAGTGVRTIRVRVPDGISGALTFFRRWGYSSNEVAVGFTGHRRDGLLLVKALGCATVADGFTSPAVKETSTAEKDWHV